MNLTKFSIERNRVVLSILVLTLVMGTMYYLKMSRDSMPPYTVRVASIISSFPGAGPERVEELVTDKIEKACTFLPICSPAGSIVIFSNTCPHRSSANRSESSRGSVYLTYNRSIAGDLYEQYFEDKLGSKNTVSKSLSGEEA